ncbi:ArsR-family transcriptional regulatory protein [Streptomyces davaonensis JCM 4913]|uniref:ArsR-family transcriptional regulatory protein n=1 Tax=Streptomyces davaonensis (strain DSM 101723 / JCM 4913 / KCC S-0913 / 768) TaxID=1214101 RepID=K4R9H6_STRDJ|nr:helix-turn-helix domain-containing protein [Streptomyces davaonensis]CCK29735.1 ArsR-family transcriptional regulatory protein [Streptomyces davaonensis JCM 4913]
MPDPADELNPRVLDARSLRGLAHPLRMALLNALRRGGPATASQLAAALGESSGATSYHLRQLAEYGFIEDAPEHGKGRERWWRSAHGSVQFDDSLHHHPDPAVRGAADLFIHEVANIHTQEVATYLGTAHDWPDAWHRSTDLSDMTLRLTPELAVELISKMHELVDSYRALAPAEDAPDAEQVRVHTHLFPVRTA